MKIKKEKERKFKILVNKLRSQIKIEKNNKMIEELKV